MSTALEQLEIECDKLKIECDNLLNFDNFTCIQLEELRLNQKLTQQLKIVRKVIDTERETHKPYTKMIPITTHLKAVFDIAICTSYPDVIGIPTVITQVSANLSKFGDYQCNTPLALMKVFKSSGVICSPKEIAEKIVSNLPKSDLIASVNIANAGFINIFLSKSYAEISIKNLLLNGIPEFNLEKKRILVDFSSPNIAKQMHVGHLRSTIIGESVCRLLEYLGHDVLRINHIGDWGTQFGMLIAHIEDEFPNYKTTSPKIGDLQKFYKESKKRFDEDNEFKLRALKCVVKLQKGDPDSTKAWKLICNESRKEFNNIYKRLDVTIKEFGESFYQSRMEEVVKLLDNQNLLELDEGRKIMWTSEDKKGVPLTIVKSDGGFTYDTSDMAAIKYRLYEEKASQIIYITDGGQATHFQCIFACAERAKILNPQTQAVRHVTFGVVLGEDGKKFKTRSGETVKLLDLLDEGLSRSKQKLIEKGRDKVLTKEEFDKAQNAVAYGCIKYADLSHNRLNEYVFSFDKMLEDKGNTAVYLLYTYARIKSIARNCNLDTSKDKISLILNSEQIPVDHEKEFKLTKVLLKFPDMILKVSSELLLHFLCEYCYEVCVTFSEFYDTCYCIEKNREGKIVKVNSGRILLCEATAVILEQCFHILGLSPLEKI